MDTLKLQQLIEHARQMNHFADPFEQLVLIQKLESKLRIAQMKEKIENIGNYTKYPKGGFNEENL